ncbi:MAG: hypothetical protein JSW52_10190 [Candidatus Coatesbacteria bacterium]|nr:MAG: hypothetical protein JSW52_10190 [Candidatus Coatesbacteria bacterium]
MMKAVKVLKFGALTLLYGLLTLFLAACEPGADVDIGTDPQALEVGQGFTEKDYYYRVTHTSGPAVTADLETTGDFISSGGLSNCDPAIVVVSADSPNFDGLFSLGVPEDMPPGDYVLTISLIPTGGGPALTSTDVGITVIEFLTFGFVPGEEPRWDPEGYFKGKVSVKSDVDANIGLNFHAKILPSGEDVAGTLAPPPSYNVTAGETVVHPFSIKYTEVAAGEQYEVEAFATGEASGVTSRKTIAEIVTIPAP